MSKKLIKPVSLAVGAAFVTTLAAGNAAAEVNANPFAMNALSGGYMQLAYGGGGSKDKESKAEEGADKAGEGKCGSDMKKDAEGKCGGKKSDMEGKCGEGKCGGSKYKDKAEDKTE